MSYQTTQPYPINIAPWSLQIQYGLSLRSILIRIQYFILKFLQDAIERFTPRTLDVVFEVVLAQMCHLSALALAS